MSLRPVRAESSAASFIRLARSAPVKPGVRRARTSRSTSLASGLPLAWTLRMAGRSVEEDALGDLGPHGLELLGGLQELLDLLELFDRLVGAGHVGEGDLGLVLRHGARLGLAELHDAVAPSLHRVHDPEEGDDDEHEG